MKPLKPNPALYSQVLNPNKERPLLKALWLLGVLNAYSSEDSPQAFTTATNYWNPLTYVLLAPIVVYWVVFKFFELFVLKLPRLFARDILDTQRASKTFPVKLKRLDYFKLKMRK